MNTSIKRCSVTHCSKSPTRTWKNIPINLLAPSPSDLNLQWDKEKALQLLFQKISSSPLPVISTAGKLANFTMTFGSIPERRVFLKMVTKSMTSSSMESTFLTPVLQTTMLSSNLRKKSQMMFSSLYAQVQPSPTIAPSQLVATLAMLTKQPTNKANSNAVSSAFQNPIDY